MSELVLLPTGVDDNTDPAASGQDTRLCGASDSYRTIGSLKVRIWSQLHKTLQSINNKSSNSFIMHAAHSHRVPNTDHSFIRFWWLTSWMFHSAGWQKCSCHSAQAESKLPMATSKKTLKAVTITLWTRDRDVPCVECRCSVLPTSVKELTTETLQIGIFHWKRHFVSNF